MKTDKYLEKLNNPALVIQEDGEIISINQLAISFFNLPPHEIKGENILTYLNDKNETNLLNFKQFLDDPSLIDKIFEFKIQTKIIEQNVVKCSTLHNDNSGINNSLITLQEALPNLKPMFVATFDEKCGNRNQCNDVSSQELASRYARSLIEATLDPLFTISLKGKITDVNNASVLVTGLSRKDLINTDFFNYFTDPIKAKKVYQHVFKYGYVSDYPLVIKDHKLTDVLINGSIYKDENRNIVGAVVVARDITEQIKIQHELIEARIFAEEAKDKAEEAVKSKQQFLSNMSHEIRTPMNAIIGFTKVVLKTELTSKQKEYINAIKISGDAMIVLINDILDLAKVDAGKLIFEKTPFKLKSSISAMLHLFDTKIQEKNLNLIRIYDENIPNVLMGDSVRLNQIILNLVGNAVKFTHQGFITVEVNLESETEQYALINFSIKDTGIGIPVQKLNTIFENFQQAESDTSRIYGGTGLGLAIVKKLIESQGSSIHVESEVNVGTNFYFQLKFDKTKSTSINNTQTIELDETIKNIKILVVEDIPLNQLLMKTVLDDFEFDCDIAVNGKFAIEKLQEKHYDIILMDLQMPEMNGFEATTYIRKVMHSNIPIIALTADVTTVDIDKCKKAGMNDYLAKPVNEYLLYDKIVKLLKNQVHISFQIPKSGTNLEKCTDLKYLLNRTKSNKQLMMEIIALYLEQTPILVQTMKNSIEENNWEKLQSAIHKIIPSFSIVGINTNFEDIAKQIKSFAENQQQLHEIKTMVNQIEAVCNQACEELELEMIHLANTN